MDAAEVARLSWVCVAPSAILTVSSFHFSCLLPACSVILVARLIILRRWKTADVMDRCANTYVTV